MYASKLRQIVLLATATLFLMVSAEAFAVKKMPGRYALVIGNKNYATAPLRNTVNDASAIAAKLKFIGFEVTLLTDLAAESMNDEVVRFYQTVQRSEGAETLAIFYYAGHALQINHRNYLVPLDLTFEDSTAFMAGLFDINKLFAQMPLIPNLQNIVILDSCRDNPFDQESQQSVDVSIADGLAPLRAPPGTLIAYATEPGSVALDGKGKHGTYTKYLLRHLDKRITIEEILKKVRKDVVKATRKRQIPWEHSSLLNDVFINPPRNRKMPDLMTF